METQSTEAKKGEIEYRRKLAKQHMSGDVLILNELDKGVIERTLNERMTKTCEQVSALCSKGIPISPYVEMGAERGQRSLVLENDLNATGVALDISFDMLKSCEYYAKLYGKQKMPLRICADANSLPFLSNSIPFLFCYQTLHHFPTPVPIVSEIHRVLTPGGSMFFDEEPFKKTLHLNLYNGDYIYSKKAMNRSKIKKIFDYFLAKQVCNEVEYGIIENDQISLREWKNALRPFSDKDVSLTFGRHITTKMFPRKNPFLFPFAYLLGGRISGTCQKEGQIPNDFRPISEILMCPSCHENRVESGVHFEGQSYRCYHCKMSYPIHEGVIFLFTPEKFHEFYPNMG